MKKGLIRFFSLVFLRAEEHAEQEIDECAKEVENDGHDDVEMGRGENFDPKPGPDLGRGHNDGQQKSGLFI